jgi:hypothetical protein
MGAQPLTPVVSRYLLWLPDDHATPTVPPHVVEIDLRESDRRWPSDDDGTIGGLIWYSPVDEDVYGVQERRRARIQIGDVIAS